MPTLGSIRPKNMVHSSYFLKHKEVFWKHEQAPLSPNSKGYGFLWILNIFSMKTAIFGQFDNFRSGFSPKWSKGTSMDHDLSLEPITKSL